MLQKLGKKLKNSMKVNIYLAVKKDIQVIRSDETI